MKLRAIQTVEIEIDVESKEDAVELAEYFGQFGHFPNANAKKTTKVNFEVIDEQ